MNPDISATNIFALGNYNTAWGPVIVIANGQAMHTKPDITNFETTNGPIQPRRRMEHLLQQARKTNGTLIPMTVHYPGENKVKKYRSTQGPPQIEALNKKILQWANANNLWPLRFYEYTKGIWSPDGVHYLDENIVFAQVLLNSLWRMQQEHGLLEFVPEQNMEDPTSFKYPENMELGPIEELGPKGHVASVPRPYKSLP